MRANPTLRHKTIESLTFLKHYQSINNYDISLITNTRCAFHELS